MRTINDLTSWEIIVLMSLYEDPTEFSYTPESRESVDPFRRLEEMGLVKMTYKDGCYYVNITEQGELTASFIRL